MTAMSKQPRIFALLEDFDHLYRYANLLDYEYGTCPEKLVGRYTEMTPARPTIAHHRYPTDSIFRSIDNQTASLKTKLGINIITAAEQQTMNYYMNIAPFYSPFRPWKTTVSGNRHDRGRACFPVRKLKRPIRHMAGRSTDA